MFNNTVKLKNKNQENVSCVSFSLFSFVLVALTVI